MKTVFVYLQLHGFAFSKEEAEALEAIARSGKTIVLFEELDSTSDFFSKIKNKTDSELDAFAKKTSDDLYAESYGKDLKVLRDLSKNHGVKIRPIDVKAGATGLLEDTSRVIAEMFLNELVSGLTDTAELLLSIAALEQILFSRLNEFRNASMIKRVKTAIVVNSESNVVVMCGTDHFLPIRDALEDSQVEFRIINSGRTAAGAEFRLREDIVEGIKRLVPAEQLDRCVLQAEKRLQIIAGKDEITMEAKLKTTKAAKHLGECVELIKHSIIYESESRFVMPKLVKLLTRVLGQSTILFNSNLEGQEKASEIEGLAKDLLDLKEPEKGISLTTASTILMKIGLLLSDAAEGKDVRSRDMLNVLSTAFKAAELRDGVRKSDSNLKLKT